MSTRLLRTGLLALALAGFSASQAHATTWAKKEYECPVCGAKNTFMKVMSWGSYIYQWPSKYQLIYWPKTDPHVVYCCNACYYAAFMWDFDKLPKDKAEDVRKALEGAKIEIKDGEYMKAPMSERLAIAEKAYLALRKDDLFWCDFHRVAGYHFAREGKAEAAAAARKKSLELAEKLLKDEKDEVKRKEMLIICGSMRYFLNDGKKAAEDFKKALELKVPPKDVPEDKKEDEKKRAENQEKYLNDLTNDLLGRIEKGEKAPEDGKGE